MNKNTTQIYTFSHYDVQIGINTSLTFTCPHDITTDTLAYMSSRAAAAFGYCEQNINNCFHYSDDIYAEFDECDCDCDCCCDED